MSPGLFSTVFKWIEECCSRPNDGLVWHYPFQEKEAYEAALSVEERLSDFRKRVSEGFPHRTDALALADEVGKTLRDQHGGIPAAEFMYKYYHHKLGDFSSRGEIAATGKLCNRWVREAKAHKEFGGFHPAYFLRRDIPIHVPFGEKEISSTVAFMRNWLGNQRDGSHFSDEPSWGEFAY